MYRSKPKHRIELRSTQKIEPVNMLTLLSCKTLAPGRGVFPYWGAEVECVSNTGVYVSVSVNSKRRMHTASAMPTSHIQKATDLIISACRQYPLPATSPQASPPTTTAPTPHLLSPTAHQPGFSRGPVVEDPACCLQDALTPTLHLPRGNVPDASGVPQ